jgi:tyrosyl-tRNA synthetase
LLSVSIIKAVTIIAKIANKTPMFLMLRRSGYTNDMKLSEELTWRGFVNQTTYKSLTDLDKGGIRFYWGVDPSADSMTIGNLAAAMMVKCFIKHGHHAVLLLGGATGMIGDPDGKADERELKSIQEISHNKKAIAAQYRSLFGNRSFKQVDNYDWFKGMNYLAFLREVGKHVPMRQMLARDFVQTRLSEDGAGISYAEFSYVLIQAYDFLQLYEKEKVTLQVCGSDQWGNSIAGVDLIRRKTGGEAHVYSVPLITNKASGRKFGKSEEGAVWLDPSKTTPTQFYQFWVNVEDDSVSQYLKIFTEKDQAEIAAIMQKHLTRPEERLAQSALAYSVTELVHGKAAAVAASRVTDYLTGRESIASANKSELSEIRREIPAIKAGSGSSVVEALVSANLASSNTEARRFIQGNAISINGQKISREEFEDRDFLSGRLLLRRGKAFKDSALVERR